MSAGISGSTGMTTVSDRLKIASIRSSSDAPAVDDDDVVRLERSLEHELDGVRRDQRREARGGRRGEHLDAARVVDGVRAEQLGLPQGRLVASELEQRLLRLRG